MQPWEGRKDQEIDLPIRGQEFEYADAEKGPVSLWNALADPQQHHRSIVTSRAGQLTSNESQVVYDTLNTARGVIDDGSVEFGTLSQQRPGQHGSSATAVLQHNDWIL